MPKKPLEFSFSSLGRVQKAVKMAKECKRIKMKHRLRSGVDTSSEDRGEGSKPSARGDNSANADRREWDWVMDRVKWDRSKFSKLGLRHYNKTQGKEFELVESLHCEIKWLAPPGSDGVETWCHVSFTARPKHGDDNENHTFFAALLQRETDSKFSVQECCLLEQGDFGESNYGCVICPPALLLHPREGCYVGGTADYCPIGWSCI